MRKPVLSGFMTLAAAFLAIMAQAQRDTGAPQHHDFSLRQTLDYAHNNNAQVKNALLDTRIQEQTNRDITSAAYPKISGSASLTTYTQIPVTLVPAEFFGGAPGTYAAVQFGTKYNSLAGINLQQVLFDGAVFVGLKARQTSIDYYNKQGEITEENIRVNIYKVYYQLVVSKTQMAQLDANIEKLQRVVHDVTLLNQNGFAERLDIDKASVQLANLQTEKVKTQAMIDNGYLGLKILIGMPAHDELVLTDNITEDDLRRDIIEANDYNYSDRKEYQQLALGKKLNEFNVKRYQLSYLPTLNLNGTYQKAAYRTSFDFFAKGGDWFSTSFIGLSLNVPIFDGFSKDANIKKARLQIEQVDNQLQNLRLSIDNDVAKARNSFHSALAAVDYQKRNVQLAESVYEQTRKKYESGLASNTDLANAQSDLRAAQNNYTSSFYDAISARVDYLKATGKLQ